MGLREQGYTGALMCLKKLMMHNNPDIDLVRENDKISLNSVNSFLRYGVTRAVA